MFEEKSMLHNLVLIPLVRVTYRGEKGSNITITHNKSMFSEIIKKKVCNLGESMSFHVT